MLQALDLSNLKKLTKKKDIDVVCDILQAILLRNERERTSDPDYVSEMMFYDMIIKDASKIVIEESIRRNTTPETALGYLANEWISILTHKCLSNKESSKRVHIPRRRSRENNDQIVGVAKLFENPFVIETLKRKKTIYPLGRSSPSTTPKGSPKYKPPPPITSENSMGLFSFDKEKSTLRL